MKKIIGICIVTLLIITGLSTFAAGNYDTYQICESVDSVPVDVPEDWLVGADQYQTETVGKGWVVSQIYMAAQEFKPTEETLSAVALYFFKTSDNVPSGIQITVCIRETLEGDDLSAITLNADDIKFNLGGVGWIMFDFDDITVTPEQSYFVVCYSDDDSNVYDSYAWFFDINNKYSRGLAWGKSDEFDWRDLEAPEWDPEIVEADFCFVTYYQEPPDSIKL